MPGLNNSWKIAAIGECCFDQINNDDSRFNEIKKILKETDLTVAHLNLVFEEKNKLCLSRSDWAEEAQSTDPNAADGLKALGIDAVSLAGKHSFDFGCEGVISTIKACEAEGLITAGCGGSIDEARECGYIETEAGRAALLSVSTGNNANEWANLSKGNMRTRAGHNPLRVKVRYTVPEDVAEQLKEMGKSLSVIREYKPGNSASGMDEGEFRIMFPQEQATHGAFGTMSVFACGDDYYVDSLCVEKDLNGNLRSISDARANADMIFVSHDFSIAEELYGDNPPKYAEEFAHAAIDIGANAYFGHGYGKMMGVEIYNGRPVFYGLGSFINTRQRTASQSVIPVVEYKGNEVEMITFYPLELDADGIPHLAEMKAGEILDRLCVLSGKYGTVLKIEGNKAIWKRGKE